MQERVDVWLMGTETTGLMNSFHMQLQVRPDDSVSNVGTRSLMSRASCSSCMSQTSRTSSASARAMAAARKAMLEAEATTLKRLHQIEEEGLKLRQRKTTLKLKNEMAKADVEEFFYAQAEEREITTGYFPIGEQQRRLSTDQAPAPNEVEVDVKEDKVAPNATKSEDLPKLCTPFDPPVPSVAKSEELVRQLNSEVLELFYKRVEKPALSQTFITSPQVTTVTPPKGDI